MKKAFYLFMVLALSLTLTGMLSVDSNAEKLPKLITWTAYDVGSTGYLQAAAVGDALTEKSNVKLRVIPAGTDIGRLTPLKSGMADFALTGIGAHFAWRGLYEFASYSWGPQKLRQIWQVLPIGGMPLATAKDADIRKVADLKGKKIPWIPGAPAVNVGNTAFLAFANLTWNDVEKVPVGSWGTATGGLIDGKVDAMFMTGTSAKMYELEASPRGLYWPEFPCDDKAGWARLNKVAPYFGCYRTSKSAGLKEVRELPNYPYPVLVTYPEKDAEYVYLLVKIIHKAYDAFKGTHPAMTGWDMKTAIRAPVVVPYHEGAVKYFKEVGAWTPELDKSNKKALEQEKRDLSCGKKPVERESKIKFQTKNSWALG